MLSTWLGQDCARGRGGFGPLRLMAMLHAFAWRTRRARYVCRPDHVVFVCFNPVLYVQYILWTVPLGLLVLCDVRDLLASPPRLAADA